MEELRLNGMGVLSKEDTIALMDKLRGISIEFDSRTMTEEGKQENIRKIKEGNERIHKLLNEEDYPRSFLGTIRLDLEEDESKREQIMICEPSLVVATPNKYMGSFILSGSNIKAVENGLEFDVYTVFSKNAVFLHAPEEFEIMEASKQEAYLSLKVRTSNEISGFRSIPIRVFDDMERFSKELKAFEGKGKIRMTHSFAVDEKLHWIVFYDSNPTLLERIESGTLSSDGEIVKERVN